MNFEFLLLLYFKSVLSLPSLSLFVILLRASSVCLELTYMLILGSICEDVNIPVLLLTLPKCRKVGNYHELTDKLNIAGHICWVLLF